MTITKGLGRFLTAGVIFGAIAGCSANAPSGQTSGWSRTDLKPVSQPVAAGGTFVLYVAAHGGLELIGLDPHSGRTLWQDVASPSVITPGVAPELLVLGDHVLQIGLELAQGLLIHSRGTLVGRHPPVRFPHLALGNVERFDV
jgi:hypothetical protein